MHLNLLKKVIENGTYLSNFVTYTSAFLGTKFLDEVSIFFLKNLNSSFYKPAI